MPHLDSAQAAPLQDRDLINLPAPAGQPVFLPPLGFKRCRTCGEKRRIKGGHQREGRFVCATCRQATITRTP